MLVSLGGTVSNTSNPIDSILNEMDAEDGANPDNAEGEEELYNKVSRMYIKEETRAGYNTCNRSFLLWLDGHEPQCVNAYAKEKLQEVFVSQPGALAKAENSRVKAAATMLVGEAGPDKQPIIFENVTDKIFCNFIFSRARRIGQKFLSKSGCGSYRSAYKELHRQCGVTVSQNFEKQLTIKFKGMLRGHAEEKEQTGGRLAEGKDPMSFRLYKFLCSKMVEKGTKDSIFSHAFLTLTWNLVCRSKNTVNIHRNHISWGTDCVTIRFAHTKTDVEGGDQARLRHVFANPYNLDICAVTALAKYLATFEPKENGMLFDANSYSRFQKELKKIVKEHQVEEWASTSMILVFIRSGRVLQHTVVQVLLLHHILLQYATEQDGRWER